MKAVDEPTRTFGLVNPETDLSRSHSEIDSRARLQFCHLRVATACEIQSLDEYPASR